MNKLLGDFQMNEAGRVLYDFIWSEYCDWYLEMAKVRLKDGDNSPLPVLAWVLQAGLRLLHPIMPFVTEAIWQHLRDHVAGLEEALIIAPYPLGDGETDAEAEEQTDAPDGRRPRDPQHPRRSAASTPARFVEAYVATERRSPRARTRPYRSSRRWHGCGRCTLSRTPQKRRARASRPPCWPRRRWFSRWPA